MDSLATLSTVLQHAQNERDQAANLLRQAEAQARAARDQAAQLTGYRAEYHGRWNEHFQQPGQVGLFNCYHGFGGRLNQAIDMQATSADQADERVAQARAVLLQREQRVAAVAKLMERRSKEINHMANQREQRQTDETAARLGQARRQSSALL